MKFFFPILFIFFYGSSHAHELRSNDPIGAEIIKDSTNKLLVKTDTLELRYLIWGCECPNWISLIDYEKANITGELIQYCLYIQPKKEENEIPSYFDPEKHAIRLIGHFYEKEDFPDELSNSEEPIRKARIFQFSEIELVPLKRD